MKKIDESKMLGKVRRWRKKAYDADKVKALTKRTQDAKKLARRRYLPLDRLIPVATVSRDHLSTTYNCL
jgi:hypothetical protein